MSADPLAIHAAAKDDRTDYQWLDPVIRKNPGATGWQRVTRPEMPDQPSEHPLFIEHHGLTLYKRPMALTERVRAGERAVAEEMRDDPLRGAQVARPLTSPRGPMPTRRTVRDMWLYGRVWLRRAFHLADSQRLVERWLRVNEIGLRRWSDENSLTMSQYVALHTTAILEGKGRWLGPIIHSVPRR